MQINRYEDDCFYYFWKPAGLPSTFWKEKCFLDFLLESKDRFISEIVLYLKDMFWKEQEYWLLNRLDNETSGLLYFAKNPNIKLKYKKSQDAWEVIKHYIADVYWNFQNKSIEISHPIWHHKFSKDRMVVFLDETKTGKIDKKRLKNTKTYVEKLYHDPETNVSTVFVKISKWVRHQIRAHLSSIWYPIVGEKIYIKKNKKNWILHLFSIGLSREK